MGEYLILKGINTGKVLYLNWCDTRDHMQDKDGYYYRVSDICEVEYLEEYKANYIKEIESAKSKLKVIVQHMLGD